MMKRRFWSSTIPFPLWMRRPTAKIRHALKAEMEKARCFLFPDRHSLKQADLILVMDKGKICELGTHEELISQEGIYKDIYEIQC